MRVLIVLVLGATTAAQTAPVPDPSWVRLIPEIRETLRRQPLGVPLEERYEMKIYETADITGDGVLEAKVYLGVAEPAPTKLSSCGWSMASLFSRVSKAPKDHWRPRVSSKVPASCTTMT
jgi:hypothetical protein